MNIELKKPTKWNKKNLFKTLNELEVKTNKAVWFSNSGNEIQVWIRQTSQNYNDGLLFEQGHALGQLFAAMLFKTHGFDRQSSQYLIQLQPKFLRK